MTSEGSNQWPLRATAQGRHVTNASEACRHGYFHASPRRKTPAEAPPGSHMHLEREVRPRTCAEEDCAPGISRARWTAGWSSAPLRLWGDASFCHRQEDRRSCIPGRPRLLRRPVRLESVVPIVAAKSRSGSPVALCAGRQPTRSIGLEIGFRSTRDCGFDLKGELP